MTIPLGNSEGTNSMFPKGLVISDLLYSKTKQKPILKNTLRFQRQPQATSDHVQQRSPFDVFAMLPAHGIWRETVSLLDVM